MTTPSSMWGGARGGSESEVERLRSALREVIRERDDARAAVRLAISVIAELDNLRDRARATLNALLDFTGERRAPVGEDIRERETIPAPPPNGADDDDGPTDVVIIEDGDAPCAG